MKSCLKKIIAVFAVFAIVASLSAVSASAVEYEARPTTWWDSVVMKNISTDIDIPLFNYLLVTAGDVASGVVCAGSSPDKLHHGTVTAEGERGGIDKAGQPFVWVKCKYCGDMFKGYASDLSAAYNDYVATLPAQGYDSDGGLLWSPKFTWFGFGGAGVFCPHYTGSQTNNTDRYNASFDCVNNSVAVSIKNPGSSFGIMYLFYRVDDTYPVTGTYSRIKSPSVIGSCLTSAGKEEFFTWYYSESGAASGVKDIQFSSVVDGVRYSESPSFHYVASAQLNFHAPVYKVTPAASLSGDIYSTTTRPTSISGGNYGIVGDNGQITKVEDNSSIVNETNNTYYNPATGATVPIVNWSYDYSDRSYKLTLDGGKTSTITYGDENISIMEVTVNESGDTITNNYTIYYLIEGSGSGEVCAHEWTETSSTPATCTLPGSKLLTCSKCQQTKKEAVPALGHDWQVKKTVTTEYDDTGQLVQQGYTIFECSRCHEQHKSTDGTAPPGGGSGTDPGGEEKETIWQKIGKLFGIIGDGVIGMIEAAVSKVLDGLISLAEMLMEKLKTVVETVLSIFDELPLLFGGFLDFLAAVFPFLPPELMTILTFGILAVVFIGIIKAVRR